MTNAAHVPARRRRALIAILAVLAPWARAAESAPAATAPPYAAIVRTFADTLLDKGRDHYGSRSTALWCGIIDVETFAVPDDPKAVPLPKGFRAQDRAVGGCNLHHDRSAL